MDVASVLVDFDGTACSLDIFTELRRRFIGDDWEQRFERASWKGTSTLREEVVQLARLLGAPRDEMLAFVVAQYGVDAGFVHFVRRAESKGAEVAIVSDGLGFYIRPMLAAAGISHLAVLTNTLIDTPFGPLLGHPFGHPECVGCGTCKMLAVLTYRERRGPVAFVGDGCSDRFAALYADLVFAKQDLARICADDGIHFIPWQSFDDVRAGLARRLASGRPPDPGVCPGWTLGRLQGDRR